MPTYVPLNFFGGNQNAAVPDPPKSLYKDLLAWYRANPGPTLSIPKRFYEADSRDVVATILDLTHVVNHPGLPASFHVRYLVYVGDHWRWGYFDGPRVKAYAEKIGLRLLKEIDQAPSLGPRSTLKAYLAGLNQYAQLAFTRWVDFTP